MKCNRVVRNFGFRTVTKEVGFGISVLSYGRQLAKVLLCEYNIDSYQAAYILLRILIVLIILFSSSKISMESSCLKT